MLTFVIPLFEEKLFETELTPEFKNVLQAISRLLSLLSLQNTSSTSPATRLCMVRKRFEIPRSYIGFSTSIPEKLLCEQGENSRIITKYFKIKKVRDLKSALGLGFYLLCPAYN